MHSRTPARTKALVPRKSRWIRCILRMKAAQCSGPASRIVKQRSGSRRLPKSIEAEAGGLAAELGTGEEILFEICGRCASRTKAKIHRVGDEGGNDRGIEHGRGSKSAKRDSIERGLDVRLARKRTPRSTDMYTDNLRVGNLIELNVP